MNGSYGNRGQRFVTAEEAAAVLRVTLNTVYRWCRAGRLRARKFGHEWRIDASALEELGYREATRPTNPLEPVIQQLRRGGERLLGLAVDRATEERLQTLFLDVALREPKTAVYLVLWDESEAEATDRLRATLAPHGADTGTLRFLHFGERYRASGLDGVLEDTRTAVARDLESGERAWVTGKPQRFFGANVERLLEYERAVDGLAARELDRGGLQLAMTTFELSYANGPLLNILAELMESHTATVWFDGLHAPRLLRPVI